MTEWKCQPGRVCPDCKGVDVEGHGPEDIHEEWCPFLTGMSRERWELLRQCNNDPVWAADEILRLKRENSNLRELYGGTCYRINELLSEGGQMLAETERLRAALQRITTIGGLVRAYVAVNIAQEALRPEPQSAEHAAAAQK